MIRIDKKALAMAALLASCTTPQIILPPSLGGPRAMTVARGEVCMDTVSEDENVFVPGIRACREGERGAIGLVVNERINRVAVVDLSERSPLVLDLDPGTPGINHIPVGERPVDVAASVDGTVATSADQLGRTLTRIDLWRLAPVGEPVALPGAPVRALTRPGTSETLALLTDTPALWVQPAARCESSGTCAGLDAAGAAYTLPGNPADMIIEPDGKHVWVIYVDRAWASVVRLEDTGELCVSGSGVVCEVARVGLTHGCADGLDNDGDGLTDAQDVQCWGPYGAEDGAGVGRSPVSACADGLDNDGDGRIDRDDAECLDGSQDDEAAPTPGLEGAAVCGDGRDNDGDGRVDAQDPGCYGSRGRTEVELPQLGFERMGADPAGLLAYVVDAARSQVLVVDLKRRALIDGPRSQEPRADVFNQQLGVTVARSPAAVTGRLRRRMTPSSVPAEAATRGVARYDLGAYVVSDNGTTYYIDAMTIECSVNESTALLTQDEFNARGEAWAASRERRCLEGLPALPLVNPAADIIRCDQVLVCASCQQANAGSCAAACDNVMLTDEAVAACQLGHRAEELGDGVARVVNPSFGLLDRFNTVDGGQLGRATCEQPDAQIAAVQGYIAQNPSYRGTQDCGSVILPQPLALDVPTSAAVRPFDLLDARRISSLERRALTFVQPAGGAIEQQAVLSSYDERMRDDTWVVTYEGVLPATVRTDGLIDAAVDGTLLTAADLCEAGVEVGDRLTIKTGPGTEGGGVPAGCDGFKGADGFLTFEVGAVRPNAVDLKVIAGAELAQSLPTRACFPRGLSWEVRPVEQWVVRGESSGVSSPRRAVGEVCAPKYGAESGRLGHRVKTGEVFTGAYFDLRMYAGLVPAVRDLSYSMRLVRNFGASSLETRGATVTPQASRATQVRYEEAAGSPRFLLVLDPSDGIIYVLNLSTGDNAFLLQ
jgi:hypothetical protein